MATLYLKTAGGNWTDATTWSTVSSAGVDNSGPPAATDDCIAELGSGNVTISAASVGKSFSAVAGTGSWTGTLTHNAFTLSIANNVTFSSGMTYTPLLTSTSCILNPASGSGTLTTAGKLMHIINMNSSTVMTLADNLSFAASKLSVINIGFTAFGTLNMAGFSINGNSVTNRVLVSGGSVGVKGTITNATTSFTNADFRDITFTSASNLDLSAITGGSGDCGGNTITGGGTTLTFTPSATQTYTGGTGSWSDVTKWTSRVPLPQDNVSMSGVTGGTVTNDMPRMGRSIDWTGASGSPTCALSLSGQTLYGSLTFITSMTVTTSFGVTLEGRGSFNLTMAGKDFTTSLIIQMVGGILTFQGDVTIAGSAIIFENGTLVDNGFNVSCRNCTPNNGTATHHIIKTGNWTLTSSLVANLWDIGSVGTISDTAGTIFITDAGANTKTFVGRGKTYNNLQITGGGSGAIIITGANTFQSIQVIGGTKSITLPGSTTTTIISGNGLSNGTNVVTFTSSAGSATISKSSGIVSWNYVNLTNIPSTGGATFYAGANSTDGGGNTGWLFSNAPGVPGAFGRGRFGINKFGIKKFGISKFSI